MRANFKWAKEKTRTYLFPTETVSPQVRKKAGQSILTSCLTRRGLFLPAFSQDILALLPLSEIPRVDAQRHCIKALQSPLVWQAECSKFQYHHIHLI